MNRWIVLLRGVNVGGKNKLPMAAFREALERAGFAEVKSYIQSGNVILNADVNMLREAVAKSVQDVMAKDFDINSPVMVLSAQELRKAATENPMGQDFEKPNWMFLVFLRDVPQSPDLKALEDVLTPNEKFELREKVFYFFAGDGAARSKAMGRLDAKLGVVTTARNWNTVQKLIQMSEDL